MLSVRSVAMSKIIINRVKSPEDENMSRERRESQKCKITNLLIYSWVYKSMWRRIIQ